MSLPLPQRRCEGSLDRPAAKNTRPQSFVGQVQSLSPTRKCKGFPAEGVSAQWVTPVCPLSLSGGPDAISRFVVSIVVLAFNGVLIGRARTHVGQKVFKRLQPPIADQDSPASVVAVSLDVRVRTSLDHGVPNGILRIGETAVPVMCLAVFCAGFTHQTTARLCIAFFQCKSSSNGFATARTVTTPKSIAASIPTCLRNDSQTPEYATNECFHT
jgi:hypothetical protein